MRTLEEISARLAALESAIAVRDANETTRRESSLWAIEELRAQASASGAVIYAGVVPSSSGGQIEWQYGLPIDIIVARSWPERAGALSALAHPIRLRILQLIFEGTDRIVDMAGLNDTGTTGQIYHHVKLLADAGWVVPAGRGRLAIPSARVVPLMALFAIVDSPE
ncbi:ArsR/SmtB family transcription factor [Salinibacterium sp. PAMC 21357]|uniref:ArsR/SmtB family transcription factor n=1 Tax=Salinibacterium sp. PAMC 21357 TaxID=1112215 RepID=UPI0004747BCD|nr:winged helix-turn-helix domain-containing protein [Salinibacterium sp. PAMC 21357]